MRRADSKIVSRIELRALLDEAKQQRKRVVLANGCFDTLHVGHVRYLAGAKKEGNLLVVGVNSDASVGNLKGPGRPILDQQARAQLVAAINDVDYVVVFPEPNVESLLEAPQARCPRQRHGLHARNRSGARGRRAPRDLRGHRR